MRKVAQITSLILGFPWVFVLLFILVFETNQTYTQKVASIAVYTLFLFVLPMIYFALLYRKGQISNIDVTNRTQRYKPLMMVLCCILACLLFAIFFGTQDTLKYLIVLLLVFAVNILITFSWKISLHMGINSVGIIFLNYVYAWKYWYFLLLLPLVFWSRLYLKRHTFWQLVAGLVVSGGIAYLGLTYIRF